MSRAQTIRSWGFLLCPSIIPWTCFSEHNPIPKPRNHWSVCHVSNCVISELSYKQDFIIGSFLLSVFSWGITQFIACNDRSFTLVELYFTVDVMCQSLFNHSLTKEYLGCFHFYVLLNKAEINIYVQEFYEYKCSFSWTNAWVKMLNHMIITTFLSFGNSLAVFQSSYIVAHHPAMYDLPSCSISPLIFGII